MQKNSSNLVVFVLSSIGALVALIIGAIRVAYFSRSPVDVFNIILAFVAIFFLFLAARSMARDDS